MRKMIDSRHVGRSRAQLAVMLVAVLAAVSLPGRRAHAQQAALPGVASPGGATQPNPGQLVGGGGEGEPPLLWAAPPEPASTLGRSIRRSLDAAAISGLVLSRSEPVPRKASADGRQRSTGRKVLGAAIGAVGGFFGGGFLGAAIEGDRCDCDDPGLKGFLVGAPVGAVTGGVLGAFYF